MKVKVKKFIYLIAPLVWPLVLYVFIKRSVRSAGKKFLWGCIVTFLFLPIWGVLLFQIGVGGPMVLFDLGLISKPTTFPTEGPSMLPTFKESDEVTLMSPKKHTFVRGDVVTFENSETEGNSYLKRIVGLGGEKILLKQGAVWINGQPLLEPYVNEGRPTFGNTFLTECEELTIPEGYFAVMGDNRALSWDSRAIGWVAREDMSGYKSPLASTGFESPEDVIKKFTILPFDSLKAVQAINAWRGTNKRMNLITNSKIASAAKARAEEIKNNFDGWKNGDSTIQDFLDKSDYRSNYTHEYVTFGYLTEKEMVEQAMQISTEANMFMSDKFTEVGVGVAVRDVGGCSYPIIVTVLAWPSVPTYDAKTINWWKNESVVLSKNISNYQTWVGFPEKNQAKLKELINQAAQMVIISDRIYKRMEASEWLTPDDYREIKLYDSILTKHNQLYDELWQEDKVKGIRTEPVEVAW